ncbi:LysR family transcriptional regulator [Haliangium sp.]|uniref:LysR family transcriptional regulator n=1 Tax=Haliangium sp. TaxID=2663208 RepID=UPI003D10F7B0
MELDSVRLFVRIAELGAVGAAARDLGMSPAAASARLKRLEDSVGARLFHRTTRALALTTDGAAFLPHAQGALDLLDQGVATLGGGSPAPAGLLRVAMPGSFGRMHVLPGLGAFCDRYPEVRLDLRLSDEILDVVEGAFDLVIRNAPLTDSTMIARKLAPDRRIVVASPKYVARHGAPRTPEELSQHRCVVLGDDERWLFAGRDPVAVPVSIRVNDGEASRLAVENGLGIARKSLWNVYQALRAGRLVRLLPDYPVDTRQAIWAGYPAQRVVAPKVRAMIDFLVERFGPVPYWEDDAAVEP